MWRAALGGESPHNPSTRASVETTVFASRQQHRQHQLLTGAPEAQSSIVLAGVVAPLDHAQRAEHLKAHTASIRTPVRVPRKLVIVAALGPPSNIGHERSVSRPDRKIVGRHMCRCSDAKMFRA